MRRTAMFAAAAAGLAVLAGPAGSAWAEESAQQLIERLQRQGYAVQIDKIGTGPLSKCVVTSVRNPHTVTEWVPFVGPGLGRFEGNLLVPVVTSQTISVSLDCSQR
jgi:hypothetical protein